MPPRVVADSNVIISALHAGGKPEAVLSLAHRGEIELYLSPFILGEVATALEGVKFRWDRERITDALLGLSARIIDPGPPRLRVLPDPPDNRILECALASRARYLVTGDRHLLALGAYRRIRILTPDTFLSVL